MSILIELSNTILKQVEKEEEYSPVRMAGRQLMDIVGHDEQAAAIVLEDLKGGHTVQKCHDEIEKWAKNHKAGKRACCPPDIADGIIRKYFGLPEAEAVFPKEPQPVSKHKTKRQTILLEDFL